MYSITERPRENEELTDKISKFDSNVAAIQKVLEER